MYHGAQKLLVLKVPRTCHFKLSAILVPLCVLLKSDGLNINNPREIRSAKKAASDFCDLGLGAVRLPRVCL